MKKTVFLIGLALALITSPATAMDASCASDYRCISIQECLKNPKAYATKNHLQFDKADLADEVSRARGCNAMEDIREMKAETEGIKAQTHALACRMNPSLSDCQ